MSFTSQVFELPSKGVLYPPESPLRSGTVRMKPMTAVEEDIITDPNVTAKGFTAIADALMTALLDTKIDADDLLEGDRNALLIYTRITAWGSLLEFTRKHPKTKEDSLASVDLSTIGERALGAEPIAAGVNEFAYQLPYSGKQITFKLLTHGDFKKIEQERDELTKLDGKAHKKTTLLRAMLCSVDGDTTEITRYKLSTEMFSADMRAFFKYVDAIKPDTTLKADITYADGYVAEGVEVPFMEWDTFSPDWRELSFD